jgi:hypothetical protein
MKKSVASRLALVSAAAVFIAACSTTIDSPVAPSDLGSPSLVLGVPGVTAAATVQVCVDPTSPAVGYSFSTIGSNLQTGDAVTSPVGINTSVPGPICATVLARTPAGANGVFATATITASLTAPVAGTWSWQCVSEDATGVGCPTPPGAGAVKNGTGAVSAGAENSGHGATITFLFTPDLVVGTGCTYTQGRWKNKNSATTAQYDFDGGTNNGLTVLQTAPKGNPYYILAHQYIAAALNVAAGASMDNGGAGTADDVLAAFQAATAYFAVASAGTPLPSPYTKDQVTALAAILDQYNNGLLGPGHCDEVSQ